MKIIEQELTNLNSQFVEMGSLATEAVIKAGKSFVEHDVNLAQEVIDSDHAINELQTKLEKKSFELIALYQPVAADLRHVVGVLKAVTDLERIGDHARNIARRTIKLQGLTHLSEIEVNVKKMVTEVTAELQAALNSYAIVDQNAAEAVPETYNETINGMYDQIAGPSYQAMSKNPGLINSAIIYLKVAQDLGRISDYGINICEWTVYLATGKIVELKNY
ncbi:phosphate signaling complex protein PhoU [Lentilactobacillus senioris]|uniref:phosphate signaling complex protein PhoU n=1 Tax=Lentilactobacillus senioris TaxID=931534 RepID=UPI0022817896|nr:phosphate signaling complex protein PhoU [Lentilactobacillus senioris]MCY9807194.1 phosphate signaling complex protein PhoU [Lentilactobacillus senioris]